MTQLQDRIVDFRRVPASELHGNPKNWRRHPERQQEALSGVLESIGIADALIARQDADGKLWLIDGHLRTSLEPETVWPTLILDVSEEEGDALLAAIDPLAQMAETDTDALASLLEGIDDSWAAMVGEEFNLSFYEEVPEEPPEPKIDQAEELAKKWGTKRGQVWHVVSEDGLTHRLLCGDATSEDDVGRLLRGDHPFIMVTDPPYGVEYDPEWRHRAGIIDSSRTGKVTNDDIADWSVAYGNFPGDVMYVWHADQWAWTVAPAIMSCGFDIRAAIVWRKQQLVFGRGHYHWQHEPSYYAVRKGASAKWTGDRKQSTIWDIANPLQSGESETVHGTQKPIECMARPIRNHGTKGDFVYDPFVGSGTTILAADREGRECLAIDIDPSWVAVTLERMADAGFSCEVQS